MAVFFLVLGGLMFLIHLLVNRIIAQFNHRSDQNRWHPIGDVSCLYNARSPLLRCAVKPQGPCRCEHYQPRGLPPGQP